MHAKNESPTIRALASDLSHAQELAKRNHKQGWAALNNLFRSGAPPHPSPEGRYRGELVAFNIAPALTALATSIARAWMPWRGKTFNAFRRSGDNIFTSDSYPLALSFSPLYRGFINDGPATYRAFSFRTYIASGLFDSDRHVLKIDYNLEENPALTVRRVLDELMQIEDHHYLGKAHLRWWWGRWQTVAFFTLTRSRDISQ